MGQVVGNPSSSCDLKWSIRAALSKVWPVLNTTGSRQINKVIGQCRFCRTAAGGATLLAPTDPPSADARAARAEGEGIVFFSLTMRRERGKTKPKTTLRSDSAVYKQGHFLNTGIVVHKSFETSARLRRRSWRCSLVGRVESKKHGLSIEGRCAWRSPLWILCRNNFFDLVVLTIANHLNYRSDSERPASTKLPKLKFRT